MSESDSPKAQARAFLKIAHQYRLGELPTEQSHPWSQDLSMLATNDLEAGFDVFRKIDLAALDIAIEAAENIASLASDIADTFERGGRVFLSGCGATGRLALTVESLCQDGLVPEPFQDSVVGFMAGGDAALIRSLEGFEDREDYGRRQLEDLGFTEKDLMIGISEGGETPFVIAATERAADLGAPVWFCFCNPEAILESVAERSRRILARRGVKRIPLLTGPMALSGSTRLQATTVQLLAVACALRYFETPESIDAYIRGLKKILEDIDYAQMARFTELESKCVKAGGHILYQTDKYGLTVLTDTTERAPTFSLNPFENTQRSDQPNSLVYLSVNKSRESLEAWEGILGRKPRTLAWPE
ncbi:MAG: SIS domain-containing protein, partial [Verrucomicrobiota bacterium]